MQCGMSRALPALLLVLASGLTPACGEDPPPAPPGSVALTAIPTHPVRTRDEVLEVDLPTDLAVTVQERSIMGTSADGSFRFFLEHRPGETLQAVLGAFKDELLGLGWEPMEEQHFETATTVRMGRGPKQARYLRQFWIIEGHGRVAVCEGIARDPQLGRLGEPLRDLCQTLRVLGGTP